MEHILHERQEGFLCAQHCLNALLQGSYFTPVDLASLGQRMDDEERIRMAECGVESEEYKKFIKQPSGNMDDSGFFSVQVISSALEVWGLELVPYFSSDPIAIAARKNPETMQAYICNFKQHWITIRKLGNQWFNLNSLLTGPELLSNTYLGMFLAQLQNDGYSIFIVTGTLPYSKADDLLKNAPAVQHEKPRLIITDIDSTPSTSHAKPSNHSKSSQEAPFTLDEDADMQRALNLSLGLDEFGKPLEVSQHAPSNETPESSANPSSSKNFSANSHPMSSADNQSVTRIIPITLDYTSKASSVNLTRENSMDELQNAIKLSMEPFLSEMESDDSAPEDDPNSSQPVDALFTKRLTAKKIQQDKKLHSVKKIKAPKQLKPLPLEVLEQLSQEIPENSILPTINKSKKEKGKKFKRETKDSTPSTSHAKPSNHSKSSQEAPFTLDEDADMQRALNLSLGLDEFGKPLEVSQHAPSNETPESSANPSSSKNFSANSHPMSSADNQSVTRIIPITLDYTSKASSVNLTRENSMDELQNAIKLSMEPFLSDSTPSTSHAKPSNHSKSSQEAPFTLDEDADMQRALNLSLGLDEFGKPLEVSQHAPSNETPESSANPSSSKNFSANSHPMSSADNQSVTRIIPITLDYTSKASSVNLTRENSMDELQNAIKLSMEPFLSDSTPSTSHAKPSNHSKSSQEAPFTLDEDADMQRALNLSLGLDEFGKPLEVSQHAPSNETPESSANPFFFFFFFFDSNYMVRSQRGFYPPFARNLQTCYSN